MTSLLGLGLLVGCGGGGSELSLLLTTRQYRTLRLTLSVPKTDYALGEVILCTVTITNTGIRSVEVTTPGGTSQPGDPIEAIATQGTATVWEKNDGLGGAGVISRFTIDAGETRRYTFSWDQKTNKGSSPGSQAPIGTYSIHAYPAIGTDGVTDASMQLSLPPLQITIR